MLTEKNTAELDLTSAYQSAAAEIEQAPDPVSTQKLGESDSAT